MEPKNSYYEKRAHILVKNLQSRHFDAWYVASRDEALAKALELIPQQGSVSWGGSMSVTEIGLTDAVRKGGYPCIDRDTACTLEERVRLMKQALTADVYLTGTNAISLDGQLVNIDGNGNRVAAFCYGPDSVIVIAGMNKVVDTLEDAVKRARRVAAPLNRQRLPGNTPCAVTGVCADCRQEDCICNQILVTRHCRPAGRIKVILVGEELGF